MKIRSGKGTSKHNCLCILFIRLTTCFGHCRPSSCIKKLYNGEKIYSIRTLVVVHILRFQWDLVESSKYAQQLTFLYCIFSPNYIFLWPEDGPQWPKHIVSLINRIQRQLCFDVPLSLLICVKHNGDDASTEVNERLVGTMGILRHNLQCNSSIVHSPKMASRSAVCFQRTKFLLCVRPSI